KLRPGFKEILLPGEPELRTEMKRRKEGIYIPDRTWEEIMRIAEKKSIDVAMIVDESQKNFVE
ncbi:hypothetical protein DRO38_02040, partial [Candidatus Bathyarchaeota archaeon]